LQNDPAHIIPLQKEQVQIQPEQNKSPLNI